MITVNNMLGENSGTAEMELKGLSTDTKPTGSFSGKKLGENSLFIELDTGDIYYYHGGEWSIKSTGGGGGGSVTVDTEISNTSENPVQNKAIAAALANKKDNDFIATLTIGDPVTCDKRVSEILEANAAGKNVYALVDTQITILKAQLCCYSEEHVGFAGFMPSTGDNETVVISALGSASVGEGDYWTVVAPE